MMKSLTARTDGGQHYPVIVQALAPDLDVSPLDEGQVKSPPAKCISMSSGRSRVNRLQRRNARPSNADGLTVGSPIQFFTTGFSVQLAKVEVLDVSISTLVGRGAVGAVRGRSN